MDVFIVPFVSRDETDGHGLDYARTQSEILISGRGGLQVLPGRQAHLDQCRGLGIRAYVEAEVVEHLSAVQISHPFDVFELDHHVIESLDDDGMHRDRRILQYALLAIGIDVDSLTRGLFNLKPAVLDSIDVDQQLPEITDGPRIDRQDFPCRKESLAPGVEIQVKRHGEQVDDDAIVHGAL